MYASIGDQRLPDLGAFAQIANHQHPVELNGLGILWKVAKLHFELQPLLNTILKPTVADYGVHVKLSFLRFTGLFFPLA